MEVKYTGPGPLAGENGTRDLTVTVEPACRSYTVRLAFASPAGRVYITPPLTLTDGEATYPLPSCLLDAPGKLRAQAVAESGDGKIAKSEIACFRVERSIAARAAREPETGELISLYTLHTALTTLSAAVDGKAAAAHTHAYSEITGTPTVPVISTDILTDAASDLKTASPKAVKTYVDAAVVGGGGSVTVDDAISGSSTNPVQNKVIKTALDNKQDKLTFDKNPTQNSKKPVESGGVYTALSGKQDALTFDDSPTQNSDNPVKSGGVYTALGNKQDKLTAATGDFTPATGHTPTVTKCIRQLGNIVYVQLQLVWDEALGSRSITELGTLTGVDAPALTIASDICATDTVGTGTSVPTSLAKVTIDQNKKVYVGGYTSTDTMITINTFYITA